MPSHDSEKTVINELRTLRRLLALSLVEGKKQREQIRLLAAAELDRHEIADLLGTTAGTVSVEISNLRKHGVLRAKREQG